jgi:hypothetical protein
MTATDSLYRGYGKLSLPLAETGETDLASLDPARDILLELFAAALTAELLPRWADAIAGTPLAGKSVVNVKLPLFPEAIFLGQVATDWPLLAVYRSPEEETFSDFTLWERSVACKWGIDYCIGPLDAGNSAKLTDILRAVPRIIEGVIAEGGHRAYATQQAGNSVFTKRVFGAGDGCCGFSTKEVKTAVSGQAVFAQGGPKYYCASVVLETTELSTLNAGVAAPYQGTSVALSTGDTTGLKPVVIGDTAVPLK